MLIAVQTAQITSRGDADFVRGRYYRVGHNAIHPVPGSQGRANAGYPARAAPRPKHAELITAWATLFIAVFTFSRTFPFCLSTANQYTPICLRLRSFCVRFHPKAPDAPGWAGSPASVGGEAVGAAPATGGCRHPTGANTARMTGRAIRRRMGCPRFRLEWQAFWGTLEALPRMPRLFRAPSAPYCLPSILAALTSPLPRPARRPHIP